MHNLKSSIFAHFEFRIFAQVKVYYLRTWNTRAFELRFMHIYNLTFLHMHALGLAHANVKVWYMYFDS